MKIETSYNSNVCNVHIDVLNFHLKDAEASITAEINQFPSAIATLCSISGIAEIAAASTIALARKLLVIIYTMLKSGTVYDDSNFDQRRKNCEQKRISRYILNCKN